MHTLKQLLSGELSGIKKLKISENLTEFPTEILNLADSLEILDLSGNQLNGLPQAFSQLKKLKIVFLSDNNFTVLPAVLGACPALEMIGFKANQITEIPAEALPINLRWLILTDNKITEIPAEIGKCLKMQKLMLAGNNLTSLPPELASCQNLELLRISANHLTSLPDWLLIMPRLTWLAFAGNPFQKTSEPENNLPEISWHDLNIKEQLGEGASGNIYLAALNSSEKEKPRKVAVKVFKGAVTSDGFPAEEMAACLIAGQHPNITSVMGKLKDHPEQKMGLVLELIPPDFKILGNPPSFQSCTRDNYENGTVFSLKSVCSIALGIASAATHLHAHKIMHGDLYAHNILVNEISQPLLSDFGAATNYSALEPAQAQKLQKLEVRAFGILLMELRERLDQDEQGNSQAEALNDLKEKCLQENPENRPDFPTVLRELETIATRMDLKSKS